MSFATKYNVLPNPFTFKTPDTHPYVKPADLVKAHGIEKTYQVKALYVNKGGKFGDEPIIVTPDFILNAPTHILELVRNIVTDVDSVNQINDDKVFFKLYEYKNKYGQQFSITWLDA